MPPHRWYIVILSYFHFPCHFMHWTVFLVFSTRLLWLQPTYAGSPTEQSTSQVRYCSKQKNFAKKMTCRKGGFLKSAAFLIMARYGDVSLLPIPPHVFGWFPGAGWITFSAQFSCWGPRHFQSSDDFVLTWTNQLKNKKEPTKRRKSCQILINRTHYCIA